MAIVERGRKKEEGKVVICTPCEGEGTGQSPGTFCQVGSGLLDLIGFADGLADLHNQVTVLHEGCRCMCYGPLCVAQTRIRRFSGRGQGRPDVLIGAWHSHSPRVGRFSGTRYFARVALGVESSSFLP